MMTTAPLSRPFARASVLGAACVLLAACADGGSAPRSEPSEELPILGETRLQLERAQTCDDLLTRIQDNVLVQLSVRAEQLKQGIGVAGGPVFGGGTGSGPVRGDGDLGVDEEDAPPPTTPTAPAGGVPGNAADPRPAPQDPQDSPAVPQNDGGAAEGGGGFSGTTVQVKDVDEADIVKADGDRIYLLHGGTLFMLTGWPASATEIINTIAVEGEPTEMFVKDGKAVVFSRVYGDVAAAAGEPQPAYGYRYTSYTKISVFDVSGELPSVLRESFVEGDYTSARRHDDVVRAVVQNGFKIPQIGYPSIEYYDVFGAPFQQSEVDAQVDAWLQRTARSIRDTDLSDWLPREFEVQSSSSGRLVEVTPRCEDYYSPDAGLTESGVTSVLALDLANVTAPLAGATILGRAERVYSNEEALLITQTDYRYSYEAGSSEQTIIHRFDIGGVETAYAASGAVAGRINDQFSLDERDGVIRVSTTEQANFGVAIPIPTAPPASTPGTSAGSMNTEPSGGAVPDAADAPPAVDLPEAEPPATSPAPPDDRLVPPRQPSSVSRVLTLRTDGDALVEIGRSDSFGEDERIFSTRFIGDKGYVVTFRQTDPLFVLDLSDPADPHVVGELIIPGFSNYLFPLDDGHLFAIGRDATPEGVVQGLALQIFDVTDPTRPELSHRYLYPDNGDSPANVDHRAIAFHPDGGIVAFPHRSYTTGQSTLEVFRVSSADGFARLGGMSTPAVDIDQCIVDYYGFVSAADRDAVRAQVDQDPALSRELLGYCNGWQQFRRGLFRENFVYGVSNTGVAAYDLNAMGAGAVGEVSLPVEVWTNSFGGGTSGGMATPGNVTPPLQAAPPLMGTAGPEPTPQPTPDSSGGESKPEE